MKNKWKRILHAWEPPLLPMNFTGLLQIKVDGPQTGGERKEKPLPSFLCPIVKFHVH